MGTRVVTGFDSASSSATAVAAEKVQEKFNFSQVFEALAHNLEVAENVFSRCAKKAFTSYLTDRVQIVLELPEEDLVWFPVWVFASSITMRADLEHSAKELEILVLEQAQILRARAGDKYRVRLIGPLSTRIAEVGKGLFTFSIKQKWGLDG